MVCEINMYCKFCDKEKLESDFSVSAIKTKFFKCKRCKADYDKEYRLLNKEKIKQKKKEDYQNNKDKTKQYSKKYYLNNKEKVKQKVKKWRLNNKEKCKQYTKKHQLNNKEKIKQRKKENYIKNKEKIKQYNKKYNIENKEKIKYKTKQYNIKNKDKINKQKKELRRNKRKNDPVFRLYNCISSSIRNLLKNNGHSKNGKSILKYLPYTIEQLKKHIENQFEHWMNWGNHGSYKYDLWKDQDSSTWIWNIDHIIPHSTFKYTSMDSEEFRKCWALENLRPYSAKLNVIEGANRIRHKKVA